MFKTVFESLPARWHQLKHLDDLSAAIKKSYDEPILIFKHSTTCGISAGARFVLERDLAEPPFPFFYLDLLRYRHISDTIATQTGVHHESPQVIVIHKGKTVAHTSHHKISTAWVDGVLTDIAV